MLEGTSNTQRTLFLLCESGFVKSLFSDLAPSYPPSSHRRCRIFLDKFHSFVSPEILEVILKDKVEETGKSAEDDHELDKEGAESDEAESDGGCHLHERPLEAEQLTQLEGRGEDGASYDVGVVLVDEGGVAEADVGVALRLGKLLSHLSGDQHPDLNRLGKDRLRSYVFLRQGMLTRLVQLISDNLL